MTLQKKISVVIPSFNEEGNIKIIVKALNEVLQNLNYRYELIFVDDGSSDKTLRILQEISANDSNVFYIELSRNFGHQNALKAGLDLASGDCIITMDGDMQHPPEMIPKLIEKWEEGYDIVYTRRLEDKNLSPFKKITSKYFYKFINSISEIKIEEGTADFRLMDKKVSTVFFAFSENELFIRGLVNWVGFNQFAIDYIPSKRFSGNSKYTVKKMMQFAIKGITSFSIRPLYISIFLGISLFFFSLLFYILYVFYSIYYGHVISGWASVIFTIVIFGGLNLIVLGIIGVYVGKLFMQSKQRPNYLIRDTNLEEKK
ncbi:MAG: glycosyltransferase [Flavobacteriaceae bacterium]|jgi:glycosyltransferase involved in cell wall biosynthesis|nr:glycosyltransferase [Flavobacteriaceae bacterium]